MKKILYSLMTLAAVFGFVACSSDDEDVVNTIKLETPEFADLAAVFESEGAKLELCEGGSYIYTTASVEASAATRAVEGAKKVTFVGAFRVVSDQIELLGAVTGTIKKAAEKADIKVNSVPVSLKKTKNAAPADEETMKLCRTWNVEDEAKYNGTTVHISSDSYAKYFGKYGYPKQIIITAQKTFCVVCKNENYCGSWDWKAKGQSLKILGVPFAEELPYMIGEKVTIEAAAIDDDGQYNTFKLTLTENK